MTKAKFEYRPNYIFLRVRNGDNNSAHSGPKGSGLRGIRLIVAFSE